MRNKQCNLFCSKLQNIKNLHDIYFSKENESSVIKNITIFEIEVEMISELSFTQFLSAHVPH